MTIAHLYIYPIKSLGGIELKKSLIVKRGLQYDRRYMLIDEYGNFLTQRTNSTLALIKLYQEANHFKIAPTRHIYREEIPLPFELLTGETTKVQIWNDTVDAIIASEEHNIYFSGLLQLKCKLVFMPESTQRQINEEFSDIGEFTSFTDGYPILVIGTQSLRDLNERLKEPVEWNRFRPNIVINSSLPFEEDQWKSFSTANLNFEVVQPCSRCVMTTIDQSTAISSKEPLRTLASYRTIHNKVNFGQNVIPKLYDSWIQVNDEISVSCE